MTCEQCGEEPCDCDSTITKERVEAALVQAKRTKSGELPAALADAIREAQSGPKEDVTMERCPACEHCELCKGDVRVTFAAASRWREGHGS